MGILRRKKGKGGRRGTSQKRPKLPSISKLKKRLEALQKKAVIKLYGTDCYTCLQKNLEGANRQLGHVPWPRAILSTICKYDHRFSRIQCFRCNIHLGGMGGKAHARMLHEGIDVGALWKLNEETKGKIVKREWFESMISHYERLLKSKNE